jgi:hypothetical protein
MTESIPFIPAAVRFDKLFSHPLFLTLCSAFDNECKRMALWSAIVSKGSS